MRTNARNRGDGEPGRSAFAWVSFLASTYWDELEFCFSYRELPAAWTEGDGTLF